MSPKKPKEISKQELYRLVSKEAKSNSSAMAEVYINSLIKVMLDELTLAGKINIRNLGIFEAVETGGYNKTIPVSGSTKMQTKYIEPHFRVKFRPCKNFYDAINDRKLLSATLRQQQMYNDKLQKALDKEAEDYETRETPTPSNMRKAWRILQEEKRIEQEMLQEAKDREEAIIDYKARRHYRGKRSMRRVDK